MAKYCQRWISQPWATVFCAFSFSVFEGKPDNIVLWHFVHMKLHKNCAMVIVSKDHYLFDLLQNSTKIFGRGKDGGLYSFDCDFNLGLKSVTQVSTIRYKKAWPLTSYLHFSVVSVVCRRFCIFSAVKEWGTCSAQIFHFKSFLRNMSG